MNRDYEFCNTSGHFWGVFLICRACVELVVFYHIHYTLLAKYSFKAQALFTDILVYFKSVSIHL
jgi:hypothetical protein